MYQISFKSVQLKPSCSMQTQRPAKAVAFRNLARAPKTC